MLGIQWEYLSRFSCTDACPNDFCTEGLTEQPAHERYAGVYLVGVHFVSGREAYLVRLGCE
jgi:hypothetical protein